MTKAEKLVREHVKCNVTGLISALVEHDDDDARDLMYGDPESDVQAYDAMEVWCVSDWLARQLAKRGHRVKSWWGEDYWARGGTGQAIYMDNVIQDIAKE